MAENSAPIPDERSPESSRISMTNGLPSRAIHEPIFCGDPGDGIPTETNRSSKDLLPQLMHVQCSGSGEVPVTPINESTHFAELVKNQITTDPVTTTKLNRWVTQPWVHEETSRKTIP